MLLLEKRENDGESLTGDNYIDQHHSATADKKFTIQPMHETIAVAQTDLPDGTEVLMTPINKPDMEDLSIAPCVAVVHSGTIPFRCVNTGINPVTVTKKSVIGTIQIMPTAPIINAIPFMKISKEQEYSHDLRCHRNYSPTMHTLLEDIEDTTYEETEKQYQDHYDDTWSQYEEHDHDNDEEIGQHQRG